MKVKIFTDGGSRGNPGEAGFGVVAVNEKGETVYEGCRYIGTKTNNEAEYEGLIFAIEWLKNNQEKLVIDEVEFNADSELMIKQMRGEYKVKASHLQLLNKKAREVLLTLRVRTSFKAIRREFNKRADELANLAMDNKK